MKESSGPKVVLITARSDTGGGPKHVLELAEFLSENNSQPDICSPLDPPFGQKFREFSKEHFYCPHRKFSLKTLLTLIELGKEDRSIVFHSHGRGAGFYTKILSLFGFTCLHSFHGAHGPKNLKEKIVQAIEITLGKGIKAYVCVSPDEKETSVQLGLSSSENTTVICNHFPINKGLDSKPDRPFENLGILSRLDPHKNNQIALRFYAKLLNERPNLKLKIAGDGEERGILENLAKELQISNKVEFKGNISDIDSFFSEIDCLISTSKGEGLPYTVLESFERGVPCVLSNVQGHRFLSKPAYLFELNSYDSFHHSFLNVEKDRSEAINRNYNFALRNFNLESTFGKILKLYNAFGSID